MKMPKHFLLLLLFVYTLNLEKGLTDGEKDAIEIQIGSPMEYDKKRSNFKFTNKDLGESYIVFKFVNVRPNMRILGQNSQQINIEAYYQYRYAKLENVATYLIEIKCNSVFCEMGDIFYVAIFGNYTENIDLNKKYYYQPIYLGYFTNYFGSNRYKVTNLKEDTTVYFKNIQGYAGGNYYPYDPENPFKPDTPYPDFSNFTIFEVLDINTKQTEKNIKNIFTFKANHEYIITIRCLRRFDYYHDQGDFIYPSFMFFPIKKSNIKKITGEEGIISDEITYGVVNTNIAKDFYLYAERSIEGSTLFYAKTEENVDDIFINEDKFSKLKFESGSYVRYYEREKQNIVFYVLPGSYSSKMKLYLVDEFISDYSPSFYIPANTAKIIAFEKRIHDKVPLNNIITYKSQCKNMKITFSNENEPTDYIIQNYENLPIYVSRMDKNCIITISTYFPKFAFFGAENPYLFNTFYNSPLIQGINFHNYVNLTQMNGRINSKYLPLYEFYNFYLNQVDVKLNIYIKQLYGGGEIYECNADDLNPKKLDFLMSPISNSKCKNKKSLFNRLWTLSGTKIISGYLNPDSYFDVYAEIKDDQNTVINLSPVMIDSLPFRNNAKYLRKDIKYTINFELNHLIKLEPGFNAEIEITNGQQKYTINSQNPTITLTGNSYTIKSNNDAMVYFFGKIDNNEIKQKLIDFENNKGKIVKISNCVGDIIIDFGFENYFPSSFTMGNRVRDNKIVYLDNLYDKLKVKLVPNEKFYIYGKEENLNQLKIEYIEKSLNNPNNDYNIFLIPGNNEDNTLILEADGLTTVVQDFAFCQNDTILKLAYTLKRNESFTTITNSNYTYEQRGLNLFEGDNKLTFKTNKPVVFTYSFYDEIDSYYYSGRDSYLRSVLDELTIEEIVDKNNEEDIVKIKFNPNYKQSSTRYIILIAQKNNENTLDKFKDPCTIVDLLNRKPQGVLSDVIYDIGETTTIEAEVDISSILHDNNVYVMNIISQELRFDKKIHFYEPKEFTHEKANGGNKLSGYSLALVIVVPILSVIIIGLVIFIILIKRKGTSSSEIESLAPLTKMD